MLPLAVIYYSVRKAKAADPAILLGTDHTLVTTVLTLSLLCEDLQERQVNLIESLTCQSEEQAEESLRSG